MQIEREAGNSPAVVNISLKTFRGGDVEVWAPMVKRAKDISSFVCHVLKNQKDVEKRNSLLQFLLQQYRGDNDVTLLISRLYYEHNGRSKSAKFTGTTKRLQNRTTQGALDRYERDQPLCKRMLENQSTD